MIEASTVELSKLFVGFYPLFATPFVPGSQETDEQRLGSHINELIGVDIHECRRSAAPAISRAIVRSDSCATNIG